jgi:ABC-type Fe3+ transport system permease subunit
MLDRFRRTSCPLPGTGRTRACLRPHHFLPLIGFLVPTIVIAYGVVLPRNGVAGVNELTVGFAATLLGAVITYIIGVAVVVRR